MAFVKSEKKGGRYTKKEQEERRLLVYQSHYVEKKSAVWISKKFGVNRNTINEDIKFWHARLISKLDKVDIKSNFFQQIQHKEIQRERLLEDLEEAKSTDDKIKLEKQISEVDGWLDRFYLKAISILNEKKTLSKKVETIPEYEIEDFVNDIIFGHISNGLLAYSEDALKNRYIFSTQSNVKKAEKVVQAMKDLGLELCRRSEWPTIDSYMIVKKSQGYDILQFAVQRRYLNYEVHDSLLEKQKKILQSFKLN